MNFKLANYYVQVDQNRNKVVVLVVFGGGGFKPLGDDGPDTTSE